MKLIQILLLFSFCSPGLLADKWSMTVQEAVSINIGEDGIMPCSFTTPYSDYKEKITVVWRTKFPFKGPIVFKCLSMENTSESGQNCTESIGRYSLSGNPRSNNISLKIKNVSFVDTNQYFCRFELSKMGDTFETDTGTTLNIKVPQVLESIYIRTVPSGEQFITCGVKGVPPPAVKWIVPENISSSLVSVQKSFAAASSSIPAIQSNTNYTCQIHGEKGLQQLSIYYNGAQEQLHQVPFTLLLFFIIISGIFFLLLVILAILYMKGSSKPVETAQQNNDFRKSTSVGKDEDIYANV